MGQGFNSSFNVVKLSFENEEKLPSAILSMNPLTLGDWIPYVPQLRQFLQFKPLENTSLRRDTVPISDIEFVTDRIIKVSGYPNRLMLRTHPEYANQTRLQMKALKTNSSTFMLILIRSTRWTGPKFGN
jgi:hypothetical protein